MLGNQTFEVRRPLSKLWHQSWKAFDVFDKQILPKLQTRYFSVQGFQKWSNSDGGYSKQVKYLKGIVCNVRFNGCRTSNVWLPSLSCLSPVRTCFFVTCPRLDENDGKTIIPLALVGYEMILANLALPPCWLSTVSLSMCAHKKLSIPLESLHNLLSQQCQRKFATASDQYKYIRGVMF